MYLVTVAHAFVSAALRDLGHTVVDAFSDHHETCMQGVPFDMPALLARLPQAPDAILVMDMLGPQAFPSGLERVTVPRLFWAIDAHVNRFWQRWFARCFDLVMVAQKDFVPLFADEGVPARWLPWGIDAAVFRDPGRSRLRDVAFVGCVDVARRRKRSEILARLQERFDCLVLAADAIRRYSVEEIAAAYQQARVVVNESILGDLTFRVFEGMACGALVVAERVENGLTDLFTPGVHFDVFGPDDLTDKVAWWLAHDEARERVAAAGRAEVMARHERHHRMQTVADWIADGIPRRDTRASGARDWALGAYMATVRGMLARDVTLPPVTQLLHDALRTGPDVEATLALAEIAAWAARPDDAGRLLEIASVVAPGDPRPGLLAAELARSAGDVPRAARTLADALARCDGIDDGLRARALAAVAGGVDTGACAAALGEVLEVRGMPIQPGLVNAQGIDVPRSAFDWYARAADLGSASGARRAGEILRFVGSPDIAVTLLERAVQHAPADVAARATLVDALRASYRPADAAHQERVAAVLAGDPLCDGTDGERARALHEAGVALAQADPATPARALAAFDAAAALAPGDSVPLVDAALACIAAGDLREAGARLRAALLRAREGREAIVDLLRLVCEHEASAAHAG